MMIDQEQVVRGLGRLIPDSPIARASVAPPQIFVRIYPESKSYLGCWKKQQTTELPCSRSLLSLRSPKPLIRTRVC